MSSRTRLLPLLLGALVASGPALAQGRFGMRTPPPSSAPHPVVPPPSGGYAGGGWVPRGPPPVVHPVPPPYVYGWGFGYRGWLWDPWYTEPVPVGPPTVVAPYGAYVAPGYPPGVYPPANDAASPAAQVDEDGLPLVPERTVKRTVFSLTAYGQHVESKGSAYGVGLGIEGEHWGVLAQWNGFYLDSLTGVGTDNINVVHLQATYSLLSGREGRLRLHLGGTGAFAPDLNRVGPSIGASAAIGLIGPLGIEGQVSYTPTPFIEFDAFAGAAIGWDHFALRGGYHWTYLDDRGLVDGIPHSEWYQGPWIGLGIAL
ncbi:MAG TPA: hypothetical protein VFI53_19140 [Myxococcaceae bacterium]|nr:hypothetical protein [Myxococcaceae bacterium]